MGVSPIELPKIRPPQVSAERAPAKTAKTLERHAPQPEMPGTRPVAVDLPEPMPGRLQLDVDRETGQVFGRIIDKESGRLIRQVPTDEALRLAASMKKILEPLFRTSA